jgi:hypothetical protein
MRRLIWPPGAACPTRARADAQREAVWVARLPLPLARWPLADAGCRFAVAARVTAGFLAAAVLDLFAVDLAATCAVRCALLDRA